VQKQGKIQPTVKIFVQMVRACGWDAPGFCDALRKQSSHESRTPSPGRKP
jgi:hypothetical protein